MSPTDSVFLYVESRDQPLHVGGLQLFTPPAGAGAGDISDLLDTMASEESVAPLFGRRPFRSLATGWQWAWEPDVDFDLEHHVRRNVLPRPGRVRELLSLVSRLHSYPLDRHHPLWEAHLIEGLADGRFAIYFKVHHSLVDGVSAQRLLERVLSTDPDLRDMPPPWAPRSGADRQSAPDPLAGVGTGNDWQRLLHTAVGLAREAADLPAIIGHNLRAGLRDESPLLSMTAPKTIFNVPITGSRRFAGQSWDLDRLHALGKAAHSTVNDVVLAMCSGALRRYLHEQDALPESPLIALVPVAHRVSDALRDGNAVGSVMCNLGTDLSDPAARLRTVHESMNTGKAVLADMTQLQSVAMTGLAMSPLVLQPLLHLQDVTRPPFNLIISNVPGSRKPLYYNGYRLDGLYPMSVPFSGQALNITCTSYADQMSFGLTGCRRTVPHLQRLITHLDDELAALEQAVL